MNGFGGTALRINLATGDIRREPTSEDVARQWMGARGFVAKILYEEVPRDADPLGPDNIFIAATGVLTGSFGPAGSKIGFGCISPATNGHADCFNCHTQHSFTVDLSLCVLCHSDKAEGHYPDNECIECHTFSD